VAEDNARGWILDTRPFQKFCPAFSFLVGTQQFWISGLRNAVHVKNKEEETVSQNLLVKSTIIAEDLNF
jgi:hypothetical protein